MSQTKVFFVEGSDYSGKTTFIKRAEEYLKSSGFNVLTLKEPVSPLREILLSKDYDFGFSGRRLLFAGSHTFVMDKIFAEKDNYDYILVDRTSVITDAIYMQAEIDRGVDNSKREEIYDLYGHINKTSILADKIFYNGFFKENSSLILISLDRCDLESRISHRGIDTSDRYDSQSIEYKRNIWRKYDELINRIRLGEDSVSQFFKKVYIVPSENSKSMISEILKEDGDV